jgi:indole-3-glycerol phosphate synthase
MFDYFLRAKAIELKALRRLAESGRLPRAWAGPRPSFSARLRRDAAGFGLAVIAEYKRASPSLGDIDLGLSPARAARAYARAGASALSVLTEKSKFKGRLAFIKETRAENRELPILRKDFIFDPLQIAASASTPASAVLLIVKLTPSARLLRKLREEARTFGLEAVVEILDEEDLALARESGAEIIQANARDFHNLSVDLERPLSLARRYAGRELWIAASGFSRPEQLLAARAAGFQAVLAGSALMSSGDPAGALRQLRSKLKPEGGPHGTTAD